MPIFPYHWSFPMGRDAMTSHPPARIHSQVAGGRWQGREGRVGDASALNLPSSLYLRCENVSRHPPPAAATCHPKRCIVHLCTFAQELRSDLHLCTVSLWSTEPLGLRASSLYRCIPCLRVNLSTCQLVVVWPTGLLINGSTLSFKLQRRQAPNPYDTPSSTTLRPRACRGTSCSRYPNRVSRR